jgi:catechol 2,3-dioxygenase-like lactoylglutathione lyase family enzyme
VPCSRFGKSVLGLFASVAAASPLIYNTVMRLNHVTLIVGSFERSKLFYRTLGLIQIVDAPPRYARFQLPDGDATLSIEVIDKAPVFPSVQIYLECDALDETVRRLQAQGVVFDQEPSDMDYLWREARLRDPDGHEIRLYHAGKNRLDPPWKMPAA